jgi:hypothetical protein
MKPKSVVSETVSMGGLEGRSLSKPPLSNLSERDQVAAGIIEYGC